MLQVAADRGYIVAMDLLLRRGANINCGAGYAPTALHIAVRNKDMEMVKYLLGAGALVDVVDARSEHTTHACTATRHGSGSPKERSLHSHC